MSDIGKDGRPIVVAEFGKRIASIGPGFSGHPDAAPSGSGKSPWVDRSLHPAAFNHDAIGIATLRAVIYSSVLRSPTRAATLSTEQLTRKVL
jgi:hypothetical protein